MNVHRLIRLSAAPSLAVAIALGVAAMAGAQSPSVIYTWDWGIGSFGGANVEEWAGAFGAQTPTLDNGTDGVLTITEVALGGDWAISDGFNYAKESASRADLSGRFDFGGLDLFGIGGLEMDISHNGTGDISGQIFMQPDDGTGCCGFLTSQFTISPGANTVQVDLTNLDGGPITTDQSEYLRTIGIQIYGHAEASPVTFEVSEIRSVGPVVGERVIADYSSGVLDGVVVKFDNLGIANAPAADSQNGLSISGGALRWVDLGGTGDPGDESGGALAWGNNNDLAVSFVSRPLDISNYDNAEITMRVQPGAGADPEMFFHLYAQYANPASGGEYDYASSEMSIPADNQTYTLSVPLDSLGANNLDLVQWLGLNVHPHAGNMQVFVESIVLKAIPEPASAMLVGLGLALFSGSRRSRR